MPAEFDIIEYLATKGLRGKQAAGPEVAFPCFMDCGEPKDSNKRKLYVNSVEGFWQCKVCDSSGGTYLLQKHFGDEPTTFKTVEPAVRREILSEAAEVGAQILLKDDDALLYLLNERGLTEDTIVAKKLGLTIPGWSLTGSLPGKWSEEQLGSAGLIFRDGGMKGRDFFRSNLLIPYLSRGAVVQMRGRSWPLSSSGPKYLSGPGESVRLYNQDALGEADEAILVEGEFDCLALEQALASADDERLRRIAIVGLSGVGGFPEAFESYFVNCKRIFIGLDPDEPGVKSAMKIKDLFGSRSRLLKFPTALQHEAESKGITVNKQDWSYYLARGGMTWRHIGLMIATAKGKRVFSMDDAAFAYHAVSDTRPRIMSGIRTMDAVLGGWKRGQVVVILAKTGSGKTVLLCNLAYLMRQYKILFVTLEMTREECFEVLRKIYWFYHPQASETTMRTAMSNVYFCDENRIDDKGLSQIVDEFEVESGVRPDVVFVDYLGYYARGQPGNSGYEKVTNGVMQLKGEAKGGSSTDDFNNRFLVITPSQVNRGAKEGKPVDLDDARDSGAIEETADFMLSLWRPDDSLKIDRNGNMEYGGQLRIDILKSRHGGKGKQVPLQMDMLTLALAEPHTPEGHRAREHTQAYYNKGLTWEQIREDDTRPVQQMFRS